MTAPAHALPAPSSRPVDPLVVAASAAAALLVALSTLFPSTPVLLGTPTHSPTLEGRP